MGLFLFKKNRYGLWFVGMSDAYMYGVIECFLFDSLVLCMLNGGVRLRQVL